MSSCVQSHTAMHHRITLSFLCHPVCNPKQPCITGLLSPSYVILCAIPHSHASQDYSLLPMSSCVQSQTAMHHRITLSFLCHPVCNPKQPCITGLLSPSYVLLCAKTHKALWIKSIVISVFERLQVLTQVDSTPELCYMSQVR